MYLYLSAANQVIVHVREKLKRNWIEVFHSKEGFPTADAALEKLISRKEFDSFDKEVSSIVSVASLSSLFETFLNTLTGGESNLIWGKGRWLDMLPAKGIMHDVLQSSLFTVKDRAGHLLKNREKEDEIIRDLVKPNRVLPADFVALKSLLEARMATVIA